MTGGLSRWASLRKHKAGLPLMWWKYCTEVYAFEVVEEDAEVPVGFVLGALEAGMSYTEYHEAKIAKIHAFWGWGMLSNQFNSAFRASFEGDTFVWYRALFQKKSFRHAFWRGG